MAKNFTAYMRGCTGAISTSSHKVDFVAVVAVLMMANESGANLKEIIVTTLFQSSYDEA